jgi:hypothetical protein
MTARRKVCLDEWVDDFVTNVPPPVEMFMISALWARE